MQLANNFFIDSHGLKATAEAYRTKPEDFPGMAHAMMVEAGWQRLADRMVEWLTARGL